jgi:2-polyprenyl-6-methoxyphenol hydroxylase-like FAD-dependent oxidoreductase
MFLEDYDVVVVGAGSTGAATALLFAGAGASVTLLLPFANAPPTSLAAEPRIDLRLGATVVAIHPTGTVELTWRDRASTIAADLVVVDGRRESNGRVVSVGGVHEAEVLVERLRRSSRRGYA